MSLRVDKGDAQQRKPGRSGSSGQHRGYSGGGGKGGGGGGAPPPPVSASAATVTPGLSTNRSLKKSGNGQGPPQQRVNPSNPSSELVVAAAANRSIQNGTHSTAPLIGSSDGPAPSNVKPVDPRNFKAPPKAPASQPATGTPDPAPKTPHKGDASSSFSLQFGTISMNGMQIPARTSSAPPNIDEQKNDQARHASFRALPTMPIPTAQKQQQQQTRKDVGVNPSRTGGSHPPMQAKRDAHVPVPSAPTMTAIKPSVIPAGAMPMHMSFQQSQVPLQFGGPSPQMQSQGVPASSLQMPAGNAPQVPPQMFISGIHSHPLQQQAMMHQGQGLGFPPQISHQLPPQMNTLGIGSAAQFPQQKPGNFGSQGPRKTIVKITHPDTHEELRLDKRTDTYMDGSTSGQRRLPNVAPQVHPIPTFSPSHQMNYYPSMQPGSYNTSPIFFSTSHPLTSTQMITGSQTPGYSYPVSQGGQGISFMNQSVLNPIPGSKPGPPLPLHAEAVNMEGSSAPSAPIQAMKPPVGLYAEKVGRPSVTISAPVSKTESSVTVTAPVSKAESSVTFPAPVGKAEPLAAITAPISKVEPLVTFTAPIRKPEPSATTNMSISKAEPVVITSPPIGKAEPSGAIKMPINKAETPNLTKPSGVTTVSQLRRDIDIGPDGSFHQPKLAPEASDKNSASAVERHSSAVPSVLSTQRIQPGISSSAPVTPMGDSGSVMAGTDARKRDPVRRSESLKEHQKKPGKKDIKHSQQQQQQQQQTDVTDPTEGRKLSSSNILNYNNVAEIVSLDVSKSFENNQAPSAVKSSTSTASLPSSSVDHIASLEIETSEAVEGKTVSILSSSSGIMLEKEAAVDDTSDCSFPCDLLTDETSIKQRGPSERSTSLCHEMSGTISTSSDSSISPDGSLSVEVGMKQEMLEAVEHRKAEELYEPSLYSSDAKVCPVSTMTGSSSVKEEEVGVENSEKTDTCELHDDEKQQPVTSDEKTGLSLEVDSTVEESDKCASTTFDSIDAVSVPSSRLTPIVADENKTSSSDALTDKSEAIASQGVGLIGPGKSFSETANVPASITSEMTNNILEHKVIETSNGDPLSVMFSAPRDKPSSESTRSKTTSGRKKRKEILSKADAAGASDLYNAYKGPDKKQEVVSNSDSTDSSLTADAKHGPIDVPHKDAVADEEDGSDKDELEDWEDAADISTPKLKTSETGPQHVGKKHDHENEATSKKYSRDFLLTLAYHYTALPVGFEIGSDIAEFLMSVPVGTPRESYPTSGRITDRPSGGPRADRRMGGMMDDVKWTKSLGSFGHGVDAGHGPGVMSFRPGQGQGVNHGVLRNPRGQASNHFASGGILSGPMQSPASQGVMPHNNADADRWQRATGFPRGLIPSPQTPLQVMHKAERKYEVGKVSDQEQAKQRQLKGILNKLTPQNFEKLFEQVKEVNIDSADTLTGVISQIFDKALMEPTFCEMYANFCFHLAGVLPDFDEDNEKITFRRLLLNKCQEEFERGEIEQAEADKVEEEGEIKQSAQEREEKRLRARRRMLGNIRLIGELYKKKMLTERIMHECIKKLLGQYQNPDEEDIEALCKLMATIGEMIDHSKAKVYMDAYFDMMQNLSTNQKLSSRVRFLLRDAIDLRKNKWQQRRKVEGPKKIEEVHRDAAQERQAQSSRLARGPIISSTARRGPAADYGPRGSSVLTSPSSQHSGSIRSLQPQSRGYAQDVRFEDRHQSGRSVPLPQRHTDDNSITLGPQGGLARGMSSRGQMGLLNVPSPEIHPRIASGPNAHSSIPDRAHYNSREEIVPRSTSDRLSGDRVLDRSTTTTLSAGRIHGSLSGRPNTPEAKPSSEDSLRDMSISAIREFYSAKDEEEVALCIKELNSPSFYPSMVSVWVTDSFERKNLERDLLARLLVNLCKSHGSLLNHIQLTEGFKSVLCSLEDTVNDAPKAGEFLGRMFAKVILEDVVSLREIGRLIHDGGEEPGRLLEIGLASEVLGSILESIRTEKGDSVMNDIRTSSNVRLEDFQPPHPIKSKKLDAFL